MRKFLFYLLLGVLAFSTLGCAQRKPAEPGILVSTDWLQGQMSDPGTILLHSGTEEGYDSLHIPGARLIIPRDFVVSNDSMQNELPPIDSIVNMLRKAGVNQDSRIVLYYEDADIIRWTTRVFISLEHAGLAGRVFVLNGGLPAWLEDEGETSNVIESFSRGNLENVKPVEVTISASDLDRKRWLTDVVVIDVRSYDEYRGTPSNLEAAAEGGHIEGAYSLPYLGGILEEDSHMFKSDADLEQAFLELGMDPSKTAIVYCNTGIRATVNYLAARHLGYPVFLFDGSFREWERLELPLTRPVDKPEVNE